ncbi:MAG: trigger factor [Pseudomonadota bacterium]
MQVSVEQTSELGRKLTIQVPTDKVETEIVSRLNSLKGRVKIDGFRPGKIPLNVVRKRFGAQVRQEVMADQMQASYQEAVLKEKLRPASSPSIETQEAKEGKDLTFTASFDVYPEFELCDLSHLEVDVQVSEVTDKVVDNALDKMRKQRMNWSETESVAENGHRVTMNFVGKLGDEEFEGGKAEDFVLELGEGRMIPGFEEEVIGLKADDAKTFNLKFPKDYGNEKLAGQEATFDIEVKKVEAGELPELDEEFAKSFGLTGSIDELKVELRKSLQNELDQQILSNSKQAVMKVLSENNELTLPESMVTQEIAALREQTKQSMSAESEIDLPDSLFEENAKDRVKLGLIIGEIAVKQELQVDQQTVAQRIQMMAQQYADPQQVIQYYSSNNQARAQIESLVMEEQVVDWVLSQVNKVEKNAAFEDIVKPR